MTTATTITIDPRLLFTWNTGSTYTIRLTENFVTEDGNNYSPSPVISQTFTTPVSGPYITNVVPTRGTSGGTSTAVFTYSVPIHLSTGTYNYYLYKKDGDSLITTIPSTSTRVTLSGNTVTILLRDLVLPGYTYYITSDSGLYYDTFNFANVPVTDDSKYLYTPTSATLVTVVPAFNTTSATTQVQLRYDRNIYVKSTGTYYLREYNADPYGPQPYILTIPSTSTRVTYSGNNVNLDLSGLTVPGHTYYITAQQDTLKDELDFPLGAIDNTTTTTPSIIKWSPQGASITSFSPQSGQFNTSATITYNKSVSPNTSGYTYVYNNVSAHANEGFLLGSDPQEYYYLGRVGQVTGGLPVNNELVKYYAGTGSRVTVSGNSVSINFNDAYPLYEDTYYITNDAGVMFDSAGLPIPATTTSATMSWYNTVISNMITRSYAVNTTTAIFSTSTPVVLDTQGSGFTFSLTSAQGTFSSPIGGVNQGNSWIYTGTQAQLNTIMPTIQFLSNFTGSSVNSYSYKLLIPVAGGTVTTLVSKTLPLLGSLTSDSLPITIGVSPQPAYQGEAFNIVLRSVNSNFDLTGSTASIYVNGSFLSNVTFKADVANTATTTINATGTDIISAIYHGGNLPNSWIAPEYSAIPTTEVVTWHTLTPTLTFNNTLTTTLTSVSLLFSLNTTTTLTTSSATIQISNIVPLSTTPTTISINTVTNIPTGYWSSTTTNYSFGISPYSNTTTFYITIPSGIYGPTTSTAITVSTVTNTAQSFIETQVTTVTTQTSTVTNEYIVNTYNNFTQSTATFTARGSTVSNTDIFYQEAIGSSTTSITAGMVFSNSTGSWFKVASPGPIFNSTYVNSHPEWFISVIPLTTGFVKANDTITFGSYYSSKTECPRGTVTTVKVTTATSATLTTNGRNITTTVPVVNNTATFNLGQLPAGSYNINSLWSGTRNVPYYFPEYSTSATFTVIAPTYPTISGVSISPYYYTYPLNTGTATVSMNMTSTSPFAPTGTVTLIDSVVGILGTGTITTISNTTSSVSITWNPNAKGQSLGDNNLTLSYSGDYWNLPGSTTLTFTIAPNIRQGQTYGYTNYQFGNTATIVVYNFAGSVRSDYTIYGFGTKDNQGNPVTTVKTGTTSSSIINNVASLYIPSFPAFYPTETFVFPYTLITSTGTSVYSGTFSIPKTTSTGAAFPYWTISGNVATLHGLVGTYPSSAWTSIPVIYGNKVGNNIVDSILYLDNNAQLTFSGTPVFLEFNPGEYGSQILEAYYAF